MKKFLLTLLCTIVAALGAMAQSFTDKLVVTINGESSEPMETTVTLDLHEDGTFDFRLPNFCLVAGEDLMPVGTIFIPGIALQGGEEGIYTFSYSDNLLIAEGDMEGVDMWIGPMLGEIPLKLTGKVSEDKIYVAIDIDMMESLGQIIYVTFGDDNFSSDAQGINFTDKLIVTINGESSEPMETTVTINPHEDGTFDFRLPNFCLVSEGNVMPVGTIFIPGIALQGGEEGFYTFEYNDNLLIKEGDMEDVDTWIGPMLGEIPLKLTGKISMDKIYVAIDIDMMESLGQIIYVTFGDDNFTTGPAAGEKSGIYLRGSFNSWGTTEEAEFLTTSVAGVYEIKNLTIANGSDGFKVADADWSTVNLGGNGSVLNLGEAYSLSGTQNIKLPSNNEYVCSLITLDLNAKTLTIVGEEGKPVVETVDFVALAGTDFIGAEWNPAAEEGRMTETTDDSFGGVFRTFEWTKSGVPAGKHEFKFTANGNWDINWGAVGFAFEQVIQLVRGGENIIFNLDETAEIKVELTIYPADLSNAKFVVKNLTAAGIETIVTEGSVSLYDLQGRRVRSAHNGVTIMNGKKMIR